MIRSFACAGRRCFLKTGIARTFFSTPISLEVVTINVPALGESISEGSIATWEKAAGDSVNIDDVVAVIETDKVTVDIKSAFSGKMVEQLAGESDSVSGRIYHLLYA